MWFRILFVFLSQFLIVQSSVVNVKVKQGAVVGVIEQTLFNKRLYYAFYGVPYAKPPVGKRRFKDPVGFKKWERPHDGTNEYHGACAQAHIVHKHGIYGTEDCLHMNIYTPSLPGNERSLKAVIVWIHGHAFSSSFSHIHGGDFLIEHDVIVVTVTHRIGAFGFLDLNETDTHSNMGLKDIVAALKWIRKNIGEFNGDKNKITVMGSDSGATYISLLLITKARDLFSKMILQSGGLFSPSLFQTDPDREKNNLSEAVKKLNSKSLNDASAKDIILASSKMYSSKEIINFQKPVIPFSPVIENMSKTSLITRNPYREADFTIKTPRIIIGFNSQESIAEAIPFIHNPHYLKSFQTLFKFMTPFTDSCSYDYSSKRYIEISNLIKNKYFANGISEFSIDDFLRYATDLNKYPVYKFIKMLTSQNKEIYVYKFNYVGKFNAIRANSIAGTNIRIKGASKGDEVCYLLRCEPLWEKYSEESKKKASRDKIFIQEITAMWANFAKTGNPTPRPFFGNVTWLPMTKDNHNVLVLSSNSKIIQSDSEENMYSFWEYVYEKYYSEAGCKINKRDEL